MEHYRPDFECSGGPCKQPENPAIQKKAGNLATAMVRSLSSQALQEERRGSER